MATALGEKIRTARKLNKLTLEELAEKTESSKSYIWGLENGPAVRPSAEKIAKVAAALRISVDYLMDDTKTTPTEDDANQVFFRRVGQLDPKKRALLDKFLEAIDDDE